MFMGFVDGDVSSNSASIKRERENSRTLYGAVQKL